MSVVLDDVLGDLPRLDLVKMDIEGHEPAALRGLQSARKRIPGRNVSSLAKFDWRFALVRSWRCCCC